MAGEGHPAKTTMHEGLVWFPVGMGGGLLLAAIISVTLDGPGWPYYLFLGMLELGLAVVLGLRKPSASSGAPKNGFSSE